MDKKIEYMTSELTAMDKITTEMAEFVCDKICVHNSNTKSGTDLTQEELEEICLGCELGKHICNVLNAYNQLNCFDETESAKLLQKYSSITMCNECKWIGCEQITKIHYCRLGAGLMVEINPQLDGCSRGVKSDECI